MYFVLVAKQQALKAFAAYPRAAIPCAAAFRTATSTHTPWLSSLSARTRTGTRTFATVQKSHSAQEQQKQQQQQQQQQQQHHQKASQIPSERATFTIRDGPVFHGRSFGAKRNISGEAVFTTSLVGYPESLSDPSYRGQILVFTQPLIGNYGVPSNERDVNDVATRYSHWTAVESLGQWCARQGVPAVSGVDTRAIVTYLREQGSSLARITVGEEYDADQDEAFIDPEQINLVKRVSTKAPFHVGPDVDPKFHVALIDCGVKENILRSLVSRGASVTVFPHDYPIQKVAQHFDGVFISNGPGDPTHCSETVSNLRTLMDTSQIPIMGICLGHQLLALAIGARTIKLKYGNRAHNIPALDLTTGRCHITSQNHGYAVDASTLPSDWKPYFVNLNDSSNEGMIHKTRPIFSTQFHPEAKGGPLDSSYLFDIYLDSVRKYKATLDEVIEGREKFPSLLLGDLLGRERVGVAKGDWIQQQVDSEDTAANAKKVLNQTIASA
ncbi:Multifunctional pyrimidine synthesis protein CAD [Ascosphaera aggregata]|nr:Multifunctional pyrimidine synthesis protein CAD [Ascosphaera aggregata]